MICHRCQCDLPSVAAFCPRCGSGVRRRGRGRLLVLACVGGGIAMAMLARVSSRSTHVSPLHTSLPPVTETITVEQDQLRQQVQQLRQQIDRETAAMHQR